MHDGTHTHGHGPAGDTHTHAHDHTAPELDSNNIISSKSGMDKDKLTALLTYMKEHNKEHAAELLNLLPALDNLSKIKDPAELAELTNIIGNSAEAIEAAAHGLEHAIEILADATDI
jgi:Xaa-Pro aminopeptidase